MTINRTPNWVPLVAIVTAGVAMVLVFQSWLSVPNLREIGDYGDPIQFKTKKNAPDFTKCVVDISKLMGPRSLRRVSIATTFGLKPAGEVVLISRNSKTVINLHNEPVYSKRNTVVSVRTKETQRHTVIKYVRECL